MSNSPLLDGRVERPYDEATAGEAMSTTRAYQSSNGDTWDLVRDGTDPRVRHQPNAASGGNAIDHEIVGFLSLNDRTPQGEALVELIGTLVEHAPGTP